MKKFLFLIVVTIMLANCSMLGMNQIRITIDEDFIDQIDEIIVAIVNGDDIDTETIEDIEEHITVTYDGAADFIMVKAYNAAGVLLFTGKAEPGFMGAVNITLDYAGANVASHIIILQDYDPWDCTAMVDMLDDNGFNEGTGNNEYEFITSDDFDDLEMNPYNDLVIIANDQDQNFYDAIAAIDNDINDFVYAGGTILWEVCDRGWHYGEITTAGIVLPANVSINYQYEYYNSIEQPDHKLFTGLSASEDLYNNYASHEWISNLPAGANILMRGTDSDQPTLVIYPYGSGLVFMTGQPLEHAYTYGTTMGTMLPRLVKLILGEEITGDEGPAGTKKSVIDSHK